MSRLFLLQDSRSYVGNDMLFWKDGGGYTTDVSKAERFTQEKAVSQHECRETDIPWPVDYIEAKTRPAVDHQYVKIREALADTGITLKKPQRQNPATSRCHHCGKFIRVVDFYCGPCPHCGGDNRP